MSGLRRLFCMNVSTFGFLLLQLQPVCAQYDFSSVDKLLERNQKLLGNEFAALIWKDGRIIYKKEVETFNVKTPAPIGASSQWLTAATVLVLADEGKLSVNDKLDKFIPIYYNYMKHHISLQQCLSHTTGIEREANVVNKLFDKKKYETLEEDVQAIATKEVRNGPGKEFFFGNYGMNIAGYACEKANKKPFDRIAQEKIIKPLKMKGTSFTDPEGRAVNPAGGAQSTANDYINFLVMLLGNGVFDGKRVMSEQSADALQRSHITGLPIAFAPAAVTGYDYSYGGWIMEADENGKGRVLTCPSFTGSWPLMDRCRNYAAILLLKNPQKDARKEFFDQFKSTIEDVLGECR